MKRSKYSEEQVAYPLRQASMAHPSPRCAASSASARPRPTSGGRKANPGRRRSPPRAAARWIGVRLERSLESATRACYELAKLTQSSLSLGDAGGR